MMVSAITLNLNCFLIRNYDMVLTRRGYKAISRWLPNEIITEIVCAVPWADQASLCRVSKLFHGICLPVLYRVVQLKSARGITSFCNTVPSNPAIAGYVRSLTAGPVEASSAAVYDVICNNALHT
jgi:hypothetical protein